MTPISENEVNAAQRAWCDALIWISATHAEGGDRAVASTLIDDLYDYEAKAPCSLSQRLLMAGMPSAAPSRAHSRISSCWRPRLSRGYWLRTKTLGQSVV